MEIGLDEQWGFVYGGVRVGGVQGPQMNGEINDSNRREWELFAEESESR